MRNTRKILIALLVVFTLLLSMATLFASAAETPEKLYLTPNANWKTENARFAAYFFGNGEKWVSMTDSDGDGVYEVEVPAGFPNVIFCRMNPGNTSNSWSTKWNQTADLTIPTGGPNHYTVKEGTWDKGGGTWSTLGSTCTHANLGNAATCTAPQICLDCKDPVVSALGHTFNSAHLCTRCNEQASFTIAGTGAHLGTEWDTGNTANDMTYADGVYTKVYTNVAAGSYLLKVARDHDWGTAYPSADKAYTVDKAGSTVTVTLKGTTVTITVEAPHEHNFVEGKCECGETDPNYVPPHEHNFVEGKCECGETDPNYVPPHEHNFVEGKCECGEVDPNYVPPHEHNFVEGKCECGEVDPDYVAPVVNDYLINFSTWPEFAKETYADGDVYKLNDIFTFIMSKNSRVDPSAKTWDDFSGTLRFSFGGKTPTDSVPSKNALQITADGSYTIKIWYVAGGDSRYFALMDSAGTVLSETTKETVKNGQYYAELTIPAAGVYYFGVPADNNYIFQIELVKCDAPVEPPHEHNFVDGKCECGEEDPNYVPPHVNSLVVGDTNKIVVSGNFVNDYNLPIEWVAFVADEKAHYEFIGDNGALAYIFDASFNLLCGATGKADLDAGTYLICVGNGVVGEFNVAVTKTAIEEPVAPQYNWWASDAALYSVVDGHIVYNGAGNTYACVGCDVTTLAAGNNTFTITITNNGSAVSRVRVDIQAVNQVGNHKVVNTGAVGGDVWTDMDWGGSVVTVAAGESVTLVITYDENTERGAVKDLIIFADSARGDEATYSADITVSGMAFSKVSDDPETPHVNSLVVGETNKIVVSGNFVNAYNLPIEWVPFVAEENAYYSFVGDSGALAMIFSADGTALLCGGTGKANLEAGNYLVCVGNGLVGEFNVAVTKSAWVNALAEGANKLLITDALDNGLGYYIVWVPFEVTEKANYTFSGDGILALVYDAAYQAVSGTELEVGTYNICVAFLTPATTGIATVKVEKTPIGDAPVVEEPTLALGDNTVTIDGSEVNLTGNAIAWYTFTPDATGTYKFSCSDLTIYILIDKNMSNLGSYIGADGVAELEAGVKYYILLGKEGVTGEFTVKVESGEIEVPYKNSVALGDNHYIVSDALIATEYEWLNIEITEPGTYVIKGGAPMTIFFFTVPGTLDENSPNKWNIDSITFEYVDEFYVTLTEAGTYWMGFRYDNIGDLREFDFNVALHSEHTFEEGKCECGEEDPNYQPPVEKPEDETPVEPQPEKELNFFEKIWAAIVGFFEQMAAWFSGLFKK